LGDGSFWLGRVSAFDFLLGAGVAEQVSECVVDRRFVAAAPGGLLRGDVVDTRMVVLGVVPSKVPIEIGEGLSVIQETTRIRRSAFDGAEGRLDERIVIGVRGGQRVGAWRDPHTVCGSVWLSSGGPGR